MCLMPSREKSILSNDITIFGEESSIGLNAPNSLSIVFIEASKYVTCIKYFF